jgi:hypothetical protein
VGRWCRRAVTRSVPVHLSVAVDATAPVNRTDNVSFTTWRRYGAAARPRANPFAWQRRLPRPGAGSTMWARTDVGADTGRRE